MRDFLALVKLRVDSPLTWWLSSYSMDVLGSVHAKESNTSQKGSDFFQIEMSYLRWDSSPETRNTRQIQCILRQFGWKTG